MKKLLNQSWRISILGPQGSGKGTQAELLGKRLKIPCLSMGQMLRNEIRQGTRRGRRVKDIVNRGGLVPFKITMDLLEERVAKSDCKNGFIIDGFPRKLDQYRAYKKIGGPTQVLHLHFSDEAAIRRLRGRRVCQDCNAIYHLKAKLPRRRGVCDKCGGKLTIRYDDRPAVIRERLDLYERETRPVVKAYEKDKILYCVDANPSIKEIHAAIVKITKLWIKNTGRG